MVRKRSRGAKRHLESDDEPETESDFDDDPVYEPAPKKYSLRQRKKPTFTSDDFEYEEDLLDAPQLKDRSDDEDFNVNKNEALESEAAANSQTEDDVAEPSKEVAEVQDELVDFEDMIRADIVVNKNRIDYDNIIQKTEIKLQPHPESDRSVAEKKRQPKQTKQPPKLKSKRGRKPKRRNSDIDEPQFLAPQIQDSENDEDYHPYKPKRTRKPKSRPAGEIDSGLLEDIEDYEFEDQNDVDYNPDDDLDYPGLSNYILDKQIGADIETQDNILMPGMEKPQFADVDPNINPVANSSVPEEVTEPCTSPITKTVLRDEAPDCPADLVSEPTVSLSDTTHIPVPDTTSVGTVPDVTDSIKTSESTSITSNIVADEAIKEVLDQEEGKCAQEKVSSTSYASVIKVNETVVNSDLHVNGVKHMEDPDETIANATMEDEDDDDIVFIEDEKKCEVIVLDD